MSAEDRPEGPQEDLDQQAESPSVETSSEQLPGVTPFTRSALRMVMPKDPPPTPPRRGSLSHRLRRFWRRLRSRR